MKTVVIGISGGVDSSVAALVLKKMGFNVIGVFMQNWDNLVNNELNYKSKYDSCDSYADFEYASHVCQQLDIPLHKVDFISEYWNKVFLKFIDGYKSGKTPNPDVLCNKYIKFNEFAKYCFDKFKCDYIATGHYARVNYDKDYYSLNMALDKHKDQTYFLCELSQQQLSKVIFPLMHLTKKQVRQIAKKYNLESWNKKDSMGICFIGKRNFKDFLSNYIEEKQGNIIDIYTKQIIGTHNGAFFYTIGQRKGLNLGGNKNKNFVCKKDIEKNILYVANVEQEYKFLYSNKCLIKNFNWIGKIPDNNSVKVRFRHCQKLINSTFELINDNVLLNYEETKSVTTGQYAVLYYENRCLGGGEISEVTNLVDYEKNDI
ncbi:tRNA 2-thiouridine(34) synthase MnmA [Malacoplasma muris]|uniref:tRNA 2-thiouridine(34) synthase MnmA n=1 Tax=Malacoplasma muris TaxID=2119 RepID=UPI00398E748B